VVCAAGAARALALAGALSLDSAGENASLRALRRAAEANDANSRVSHACPHSPQALRNRRSHVSQGYARSLGCFVVALGLELGRFLLTLLRRRFDVAARAALAVVSDVQNLDAAHRAHACACSSQQQRARVSARTRCHTRSTHKQHGVHKPSRGFVRAAPSVRQLRRATRAFGVGAGLAVDALLVERLLADGAL
jgi:hypothetical protein